MYLIILGCGCGEGGGGAVGLGGPWTLVVRRRRTVIVRLGLRENDLWTKLTGQLLNRCVQGTTWNLYKGSIVSTDDIHVQ